MNWQSLPRKPSLLLKHSLLVTRPVRIRTMERSRSRSSSSLSDTLTLRKLPPMMTSRPTGMFSVSSRDVVILSTIRPSTHAQSPKEKMHRNVAIWFSLRLLKVETQSARDMTGLASRRANAALRSSSRTVWSPSCAPQLDWWQLLLLSLDQFSWPCETLYLVEMKWDKKRHFSYFCSNLFRIHLKIKFRNQ